MERIKKVLNAIVPARSVIPLLVAVTFNLTVYGGARAIAGEIGRASCRERV